MTAQECMLHNLLRSSNKYRVDEDDFAREIGVVESDNFTHAWT